MLAMCRDLGFKVASDPEEPRLSLVSFELEAAAREVRT
jgi:hypothetical protein